MSIKEINPPKYLQEWLRWPSSLVALNDHFEVTGFDIVQRIKELNA